ncbi:nonsense-mediated mRNA decay factor SMG9 [Toxorhynchites rutilus septentrionalis]|uniref:nonsense-mediated mRNA decay factor SMG9 n=1 Tax=Toxorhynchites rutilus septentrionalis TaxID=329112 RepID=UPI0024785519|nr:nonsense-mediated mRNA decay factor SMG9 [Toxorhynchites rutilus septentrionalis]
MDGRKGKKSSNNKKIQSISISNDGGKPTSSKDAVIHPKILLKTKENRAPEKAGTTLIIATKPTQSKNEKLQKRDAPKHGIIPVNNAVFNCMTKPVNLITFHSILDLHTTEYLQENNSHFLVVGAIGTQNTGKSTILNILAGNQEKESILNSDNGIFPTKTLFSQLEQSVYEDEVQMYITKDRVFLLDSAPVLLNRVKKDFIVSELEDMRTIMFLLSACHVLLVIQEDYHNINFIRLLLCAEMMNQHQLQNISAISPRIIFIKNKSNRKNLEEKSFHQNIYKNLFRNSKLKIFTNENDHEEINMLSFPKLNNGNCLFTEDEHCVRSMQKLRQRVFMTPTLDCVKSPEILTEKSWYQMINNVIEGYNNNYFLRKYENLKEKYNLHNHVNVVENATKEKNYTNFVDIRT